MRVLFQIFNKAGEKINTYYTKATQNADQNKPLVILIHGLASASDTLHNQTFANAFQKAGYSTLQIDTRNSNSNTSAGQLADFTMEGCNDDLATVIDWVKQEHPKWTANNKVILAGHSMGGYSVLSTAAKRPNDIAQIIAFSPVISGEAVIKDACSNIRDKWKSGTHEEPQTGNTGKSNIITDKHWNEWRTHDLSQQAKNITQPVILIQAELDCVTPKHRCIELQRQIPNATYIEIPDTGHAFRTSGDLDETVAVHDINQAVQTALSL